ncbi:MAG: cell division protein FtsA [Parcubacteria group bacterium]|nr:cell division protein FtsA [Parcubacteria group bacterium]
MIKDEIITGIDLGSSVIRIVVGSKSVGNERFPIQVIGVAEVPSEGLHRGIVTSIEDAVSSISLALEKAERMAGVPVERAYVSISGGHILAQNSKGVIAVSKANGEIKEEDVDRVIEAAQAVTTPPNYEILHVVPKTFMIDNQGGIKDPVGMTGVRLEVEAQIIQGLSSQIKNLTKAVYRTGIEVDDLVIAPLAAAESVLTKRQKELGIVLLNLGESTTSVAVFEEGDLVHTAILPLGSGHITSDIAIGLRTSIEAAEQIKVLYGGTFAADNENEDQINLKEFTAEDVSYSRRYVSAIIEARLEEIYELVDKELRKIGRSGLLPGGIILVGGGAKLNGCVEIAKKKFRLPAMVGYPNLETSIEKVNDPVYAVAVGLVLWGDKKKEAAKSPGRFLSLEGIGNRVTQWFKSLIP